MPNTASAKKRLRQSIVRRARNRSIKSDVRTQLRKLRELIGANEVDKCETEFRLLAKKLDRAAARNVFHANAAARVKSRFSKAIKSLKA